MPRKDVRPCSLWITPCLPAKSPTNLPGDERDVRKHVAGLRLVSHSKKDSSCLAKWQPVTAPSGSIPCRVFWPAPHPSRRVAAAIQENQEVRAGSSCI